MNSSYLVGQVLARLSKRSFLCEGRFSIIRTRAIFTVFDAYSEIYGYDEMTSNLISKIGYLLHAAELRGFLQTSRARQLGSEYEKLLNCPSNPQPQPDPIESINNNPRARSLMGEIEENRLSGRWKRKRARTWSIATGFGEITYEWTLNPRHASPHMSLFFDHGPHRAVQPAMLFRIWTPSYLSFSDIDGFEGRYANFLDLLDVMVDEYSDLMGSWPYLPNPSKGAKRQ